MAGRSYFSGHDPSKKFGDRLRPLELRLNSIIARKDIRSYESALYELLTLTRDYAREISIDHKEFLRIDTENLTIFVDYDALERVKAQAPKILLEEINLAVSINTEFDHPKFYDRLVQVVEDPRTFTIELLNGIINVKLNLDITAGPLREWVSAIKGARKLIPRNKKSKRAPQPERSKFWAEKFYGPAREGKTVYRRVGKGKKEKKDITQEQIEKYWRTMDDRFSLLSHPAPFWGIINYGVANKSSENEDGGGYPTPRAVRTNFTGKTRGRLVALFQREKVKGNQAIQRERQEIAAKYIRMEREIIEFKVLIEQELRRAQEQQARETARQEARYIRTTTYSFPASPAVEEFTPKVHSALQIIKEHLGEEKLARVDSERLQAFADTLEQGSTILQEKISLGGGVRIRTVEIARTVRGY